MTRTKTSSDSYSAASLVAGLGNEGVLAIFNEADLRDVRQVEPFIHGLILLDFPGDGLVFGGILGIQAQVQLFVQVETSLVSRSSELDDGQNLDGSLVRVNSRPSRSVTVA